MSISADRNCSRYSFHSHVLVKVLYVGWFSVAVAVVVVAVFYHHRLCVSKKRGAYVCAYALYIVADSKRRANGCDKDERYRATRQNVIQQLAEYLRNRNRLSMLPHIWKWNWLSWILNGVHNEHLPIIFFLSLKQYPIWIFHIFIHFNFRSTSQLNFYQIIKKQLQLFIYFLVQCIFVPIFKPLDCLAFTFAIVNESQYINWNFA